MKVRSPIWILDQVFRGLAAGEEVDLGATRTQLLGIRDQLAARSRATGRDLLVYVDPYLEVLDVLEVDGAEVAWRRFSESLVLLFGGRTI